MRFRTIYFLVLLLPMFAGIPVQRSGDPEGSIKEGLSVNGIRIGMSLDSVKMLMKSDYKRIKWVDYSYQYHFIKEGISVYIKQGDKEQKVFAIDTHLGQYKGNTGQGLKLMKGLKVKDVLKVYGSPDRWLHIDDSTEVNMEYNSIGFHASVWIGKKAEFDEEANNDSLWQNNPITTFTVGTPGSDY